MATLAEMLRGPVHVTYVDGIAVVEPLRVVRFGRGIPKPARSALPTPTDAAATLEAAYARHGWA